MSTAQQIAIQYISMRVEHIHQELMLLISVAEILKISHLVDLDSSDMPAN
jgi:hypothetical protein